MRLNHVGICVKDVEKSIRFYRDAFGLTLYEDRILSGPEVDTVFNVKDGKLRMVLLLDEAMNAIELYGWKSETPKERPSEHNTFTSVGIVEVSLLVDNIEATEKRLVENGYHFRTPLWSLGKDTDLFGDLYAKVRYVEDPDGVQVELIELVPEKTPDSE